MARVVKGKTDLWTTSPQIAKLLLNHDDGYNLSLDSHKKADFACPYCNTVINRIVRSIYRYGFSCPCCSDGISYPEKFISNLLKQLNVNFKHEISFGWSNGKRYDFYIENKSLIIEAHGMQHYRDGDSFYKGNNRSQNLNDEYKEIAAINNGIIHYIQLDCRYSDFDYIKYSVINSKLSDIYDLSLINWDQLKTRCLKSKVIEVCELYNSGVKSTEEISNLLDLHITTVVDYLQRCANAGLCDYLSGGHKRVICVDTGKIYDGLEFVKDDGFNVSQVSECCNNAKRAKTAGGYNWCFYDDYDPNTYVMKTSKYNNNPKKVLCVELNKIYDKLLLVKEDGFLPSAVSKVCNGKSSTHKKYHFEFV